MVHVNSRQELIKAFTYNEGQIEIHSDEFMTKTVRSPKRYRFLKYFMYVYGYKVAERQTAGGNRMTFVKISN